MADQIDRSSCAICEEVELNIQNLRLQTKNLKLEAMKLENPLVIKTIFFFLHLSEIFAPKL